MELLFQHRWETDSKKKPPRALSSGRYYGKSLCKEKALRVIGRKSESEQCRCEDGNIQGSRSNECKCPGARCTWLVQRADVYGALVTHHSWELEQKGRHDCWHHEEHSHDIRSFVSISLTVCISLQGCHNQAHRLGGSNNRKLFPPSLGDWESTLKISAGLLSSEASLLDL